MNYTASVADFFKSPKWMMNLLLAGACVFIPIVGVSVIKGWLAAGFWGREEEAPGRFPNFDFNNFAKYLEFGIWPFLVTLVASFSVMLATWFLVMPVMIVPSLLVPGNDSSAAGIVGGGAIVLGIGVVIASILASLILLIPMTLRATLAQDFGSAFDFAWSKRFIALTWKECLIASLFLVGASIVLMGAGLLLFCVGTYFANAVIHFCGEHLHKQLYRLYLSRGGEPVPVSPKLRDFAMPPLPRAVPPPL